MAIKVLFLSIFLLLLHSHSSVAVSDSLENITSVIASDADDCVYTVYIRTGSFLGAGTDSVISLKLYDEDGNSTEFSDLQAWGGLMGQGHDYYENGNLDIFSGRGKCLSGAVCAMNLTSDGSGFSAAWYVNFVEVTQTGLLTVCAQELFTVDQWLSSYIAPFELTASRNNCYVPTKHHVKVIKSLASEM